MLFGALLLLCPFLEAQEIEISGQITSEGNPVPFANIMVANSPIGTATNENGFFELTVGGEPLTIVITAIGYVKKTKNIDPAEFRTKPLNIELLEDVLGLNEVVLSATRYRVNKNETPVVVNVLESKLFNATQSLSVADALIFSPGVRVETNCQNCGFTQVRINGLPGAYSQILINGRAVFSALNSVYGLEQIPTNIVDRIEVVRSGGSALYGSSAIAGTINIITKEPVLNSWAISSDFGLINGESANRSLAFNASVVSDDLRSGVTVFGIDRDRESYDANGDGFTELVKLKNTSVGTKAFLLPNDNSKISLDLTALKEYRRGGERLYLAPHLTDITEELTHNTLIGGLTYDFFNDGRSNNFTVYVSGQNTNRMSYYGGLGGGRTLADTLSAAKAYGNTDDFSGIAGAQFTKNFDNEDVLILGAEYKNANTNDQIAGYNRIVDQNVNSYAAFAQYEWSPFSSFTALLGARLDHVKVNGLYTVGDISREVDLSPTVISPRFTFLYDITKNLQFRGGYARGFRAPQAFNEDLHISSVGGEPKFVILSEDLETEFSNAYTGSLNYSATINKLQMNFLLEGFYTQLQNTFTTVSTGSRLPNGSIVEEVRNGSGAYVAGTNFQIGVSPSSNFIFQLGGTVQNSVYDEEQILFEASPDNPDEMNVVIDGFVRTPNLYGYFNTNFTAFENTNLDITGTYTGPMTVPKVVSETGFLALTESPSFFDVNLRLNQHIDITEDFHINLSGGVKNVFNSYQDDFDSGPTRDSDYVYGPSQPRTFFIGIEIGNLHF